MRAKIRIIFLVILIAAVSSGTSMASAGEPLINSPGVGCCPESGAFTTSAETTGPAAVHRDTMGWEYAWQEYSVSPEDTIWFVDFLVVGGDTLLWEQVYGWEFAWQEYNVSPEDTIWFDDFLVVGGDTLDYDREYSWSGNDPKLRIIILGPATDWYDPGLLFRFDDLRRYHDPFYVGYLWRNRNGAIYSFDGQFFVPYIGPLADWIEIAVHNRAETRRPLYTYYMPLPPQGPDTPESPVEKRRINLRIQNPLISAVLSLLSPESAK
jgi:hypothetical protein